MTPLTPPPGSLFLRHIPGIEGRVIAALQAFVRGGSFWTHAGLVLDRGQYIQGQPGGAVIRPISDLFDGQPVLFSDAPIQRWLAEHSQSSYSEQLLRELLVTEGRKLEHVKYSYLDYPVLGLAEWAHTHRDRKLAGLVVEQLRDYVEQTGHRICSALFDLACLNAGIHLYDDGRLPGDVTPQDLADYAAAWS
jgi:hypothetical protein